MKKTKLVIFTLLFHLTCNAQTVGIGAGEQTAAFSLDNIENAYSDGENQFLDAVLPIEQVKRITFSKGQVPDLSKTDNPTADNELKRVFFTAQANNGKVLATVEAEKDGNQFRAFIPYLTDFSQLKASFVATGSVWVEREPQKSGVTENNFKNEVVYKVVSAKGDVQTFSVKVYNSQLPVLRIEANNNVPFKVWSEVVNATLSTADNSEVYEFTTQLKMKGSRYSIGDKRSLSLKNESKTNLLGMGKSKRWVLLSNSQDASLLRTHAGFWVASLLDGMPWTPREQAVELVLGNNHMGTYYLCEQVRTENDRVEGSSLWRFSESAEMGEISYKSSYTNLTYVLEDAADDITEDQAKSTIRKFEEALYSDKFQNTDNGYQPLVDINSFADWQIANEVMKNTLAATEGYFYINASGKIAIGPVNYAETNAGNNNQSAKGFAVRNSGWLERMMQDPYFAAKVAERYNSVKSDLKKAANDVLEDGLNQLKLSQNSNESLWNVFGMSQQPSVQKEAAYKKSIDALSAWLEERFEWLDFAYENEGKIAKEEKKTSMNELLSFKLQKSGNEEALLEDYTAAITSDSVKLFIPYLVHFDLTPTFEAANGATVYLDNEVQSSGKTTNNYLETRTYKVVAQNGDVRTYKVCIYNSGIPVLYINTPNGTNITSKEVWVENTTVDIYLKNGVLNFTSGKGQANIKGRGNSTWDATTEKRPYAIKLNEKGTPLGMLEHKRWVLMANYYDATFFRNDLANYLAKKSTNQQWSPSGYNVELVLNGKHKGNYYFCEQVRESSTRCEGEYLVEADRKANAGQIKGVKTGNYFNIKDPDVENNSTELQYVKGILDNFENTLYGPDFLDPEKGYKKLADMESFVDWYLIKELSKDYDGNMFTSCYSHIMPDGTIKMGPIWDFDLAFGGNPFETMMGGFGGTDYAWYNQPEGYHIADADWFVQMWKDPDFVTLLRKKVDAMVEDMDDIMDYIDEHTRLLTLSASANKVGYTPGGGFGGWNWNGNNNNNTTKKTYSEEMQVIKDFVKNRLLWMQQDLK